MTASNATVDAITGTHLDEIPGTYIFDGTLAAKGYALNKMCYSFNDAANRREFARDEDAYCSKFGLSAEQRDAVRWRDVLALLAASGNVYYLAKLFGIFGRQSPDVRHRRRPRVPQCRRRLGLPTLPPYCGDPELSWHLIESLVADEFDVATCQEMRVDHTFTVPQALL